ncbi:hypothetical protein PAAL109150_06255 [Paenibacillus alkaliterrae]
MWNKATERERSARLLFVLGLTVQEYLNNSELSAWFFIFTKYYYYFLLIVKKILNDK